VVPITAPTAVCGEGDSGQVGCPESNQSSPVALRLAVPGGAPSPRSLARPKSRIFTKPSFVTIRFSGLRSRWTMPAACALASPSAACAAMSNSRRAGSGRPSCDNSRSRSVCPSTSSMTMYGRPEVSPISWIVTMFGWFSWEAARAS
jgi:hypothetical protein